MSNNFGFQGGGGSSTPTTPFVESVTGLNTDNTDPQNPVVEISVDGTTITGDGTPANPLVALCVQSVSASSPIASTGGATPIISIPPATTSADGYLTSTDWNTFKNKQNALTLTTTGTSGASTLVGDTLNIPQYSGGASAVTKLGLGTTGTNVTGTTTNTITQSILIPANTLTNPCTLDILSKFTKTIFLGGATYRLYINTSNSLTGATLLSSLQQTSGGGNIPSVMATRSFFFDGTNLLGSLSTSFNQTTDIGAWTVSQSSVAYNSLNSYYLIWAIQLTNVGDSSIINGFRVLKYA